jgi:hypothetical protein
MHDHAALQEQYLHTLKLYTELQKKYGALQDKCIELLEREKARLDLSAAAPPESVLH